MHDSLADVVMHTVFSVGVMRQVEAYLAAACLAASAAATAARCSADCAARRRRCACALLALRCCSESGPSRYDWDELDSNRGCLAMASRISGPGGNAGVGS